MPLAATQAPCQNVAVRMKPGLFPGDFTFLEKHAWNRMVLSYPGERSFVEVIYPGIPDMGPEGRSAVEKQGGECRAHSPEGTVQARALQDASLSLLYSIDNLSDNIRVTGDEARPGTPRRSEQRLHPAACPPIPSAMASKAWSLSSALTRHRSSLFVL